MISWNVPATLLELLYVREIWGLDPLKGLPRVYPRPGKDLSPLPSIDDVEKEWLLLWENGISPKNQYEIVTDGWRTTHGGDAFDHRTYGPWSGEIKEKFHQEFFDPKHHLIRGGSMVGRMQDVKALGIQKLFLLPLQDGYALRPSSGFLVVSAVTMRQDTLWDFAVSLKPADACGS